MNIEKVKNHFKEKGKVYIGTAAGIIVGTAVGMFACRNGVQIIDSIKLINWKSSHISQNIMFPRGHRGNKVRHDQTGILYASQNLAAESLGLDPGALSKHLNGRSAHVKGNTFTNLGENLSDRIAS